LESSAFSEKDAFIGTLQMKIAGLLGNPEKKLSWFKAGHIKLESAISADSLNAELRFLRLMIQEHAPAILGYKKALSADRRVIRANFTRLPGTVQQAVLEYSRHSTVLKPEDF